MDVGYKKSIRTLCTKEAIRNKDSMSQTNREISSCLIGLKQGHIINRDRRTGLDLMRNASFPTHKLLLKTHPELFESELF